MSILQFIALNNAAISQYIFLLSNRMIINIIILFIFLVIAFIAFRSVYKPWKQLQRYQKQFTAQGYKVLQLKFVPLYTVFKSTMDNDFLKHQDCHYNVKKQWSKYDVVINNFIDRAYIQLISPNLDKEFYEIQNEKTIRKWSALTLFLQKMVGKSITFAEGQAWKHKRKVLTKFLNFSFIKSITSKIQKITKRQIQKFYLKHKIEGQLKSGKPVAQIYLQQLAQMITSTVVAELFFGGGKQKVDSILIDNKSLPHYMRDLMQELFWQTLDPVSMILGVKFVDLQLRQRDRKYAELLKGFRQFTTNFVHSRLQQIQQIIKLKGQIQEPKDLVQAFYIHSHQQGLNKKEFVENLINDFANLYTAGTDTTQHAIMMMMYFVNKDKNFKEKLLEQIKQKNINLDQLTYESVKNLTYLDAIINETLRMYQTANGIFPRQVLTDISVGGVKIKKGSIIMPQTFPTHYKQQIYQDAGQFKPQRWIDGEGKLKIPLPYAFNTFSQGIRSCIGKQLALQQIKLFGVYFISKYETQFQTLDLKYNFHGFAYQPQPIKMKFWQKM